jgi:quercetin dioxygenase-like cupin family protein
MHVADGYELRLIEDTLQSGAGLQLASKVVWRVVYVAHGAATVAGQVVATDQAAYAHSDAEILAGNDGAAIWRWELAPIGDAPILVAGRHSSSRVKLSTPLERLVASSVLMRADSVTFPPGGCAYLHTHQGPGIRCLIEGGIRIEMEGSSTCYAPGGAWLEPRPAPLFAQAAQDRASRFIRVMILPADLKGGSSITYVNAEDRDKPKSQRYKGYLDETITL